MRVAAESFVLAWDPPADASEIDSYHVYARPRGEYQWQSVSEVQAGDTPTLTVTQSLLTYGTWEFAVAAVAGGVESDFHTSMDDDAMPATGWFLEWTAP
ncbi:MAG: fibronectin type III domain-containing protein [Halomonas sp.]|uniref:fibronectin type III domain-containing protein n=1 Tax=Halomonas sp. TaxID=1486246 RepID=UPI002ACEA960|nr:fibronectin type III domain-containing protein [Halomonas sp.]MDZ7852627.1 fibronectin type III domain-containing protein [Halomonas sp.]